MLYAALGCLSSIPAESTLADAKHYTALYEQVMLVRVASDSQVHPLFLLLHARLVQLDSKDARLREVAMGWHRDTRVGQTLQARG